MDEVEVFDLRLRSEPVTVVGIDGKEHRWTVNELPGSTDEEYMDEGKDHAETKVNDKGEVTIRINSFKGMYDALLRRSLRDEQGELVKPEVIAGLPTRVRAALFKKAQRISALNKDGQDAVKNV